MATDAIRLHGCTPTPLASYLKALGVLRLISSPANHANASGVAADAHARGWWENGCFHIATSLGEDDLIGFFLNDYAPSAIIAPWNGGSGFYPKDNKEGIGPLATSASPRFRPIAEAIDLAAGEIRRRGWSARPESDAKTALVHALRGLLDDSALHWLDATVALSGERLSFPQLLGTGGNDGRLDFTNNFMRRLAGDRDGLFDAATGAPAPACKRLLRAALQADSAQGLRAFSPGQFAPGAAGGANASVGYDGNAHTNPWDFVLALEGAVLFAGAATRRHQGAPESGASFPFTVHPTAAGSGSVAEADRTSVRAEFWAPLWSRPAGCAELVGVLKEGRAILHGRTARDGLDFARAASSLGVSRGIAAFQRYGFAMRQGNMYLAAPLGTRRVTAHVPEMAELINDFDAGGWLQQVRRMAQDKNAPARARQVMKRFQDALFALAESQVTPVAVQNAIETLGEIVGWLATTPAARSAIRPPPLLRAGWVQRADDGTAEYRAAAALASLGWTLAPHRAERVRPDATTGVPEQAETAGASGGSATAGATLGARQPLTPLAAHLAPVAPETVPRRFREWAPATDRALSVWGPGNLFANLIDVLEVRVRSSSVQHPFVAAAPAQVPVVAEFLGAGNFDDQRCASLLQGLVWARPISLRHASGNANEQCVPFAYTALKLLFAPEQATETLTRRNTDEPVRRIAIPPGLITRLRGGDVDWAVRSALSRARASGIPSPFAHGSDGRTTRFGAGTDGRRLAAAMLIAIHDRQLQTLFEKAYPTDKETEDVA